MLIRADARSIPLVNGCVQTCVTSPPYYALRNYGHDQQIGLEQMPYCPTQHRCNSCYVCAMVQVFREVRRVLKDDGTTWLNLGDSYAGVGAQTGGTNSKEHGRRADRMFSQRVSWAGMKQKDLLGIPWRVAIALQADGWYLRSDIIWAKPNPMPESVTDRPTKAHEYIFLLAKNERYYYDAGAIRENATKTGTLAHRAGGSGRRAGSREGLRRDEWMARKRVQEPGSQPLGHSEVSGHPLYSKPYTGTATKDYESAGAQDPSAVKARIVDKILAGELDGRNRRSVWTVPTSPYEGAHFATFPEKLIEPCILAGAPLGGLVFDPFCGSGTTIAVAQRLGRRGVGTDLSYQQLAQERTAQRGIPFSADVPDDNQTVRAVAGS